jgi:hypothetical protein
MKNTVIEVKGAKLVLDLSSMTPTAREKWLKQAGAVIKSVIHSPK